MATKPAGTLALLGGGEWHDECRALDEELLAASGGTHVVVVPTAAAFEHPDRAVARATTWFAALGAGVTGLPVLNRRDAERDDVIDIVRGSSFVYIADGSPLHLRSVLKGSALYGAVVETYERGGVVAASGAGATLLCDPMVDPRGGAYTVGLGLVTGLAVFPYHGTVADHMRERTIDLLPADATLVGLDEHTAIVRDPTGDWRVVGPGTVTLYRAGAEPVVATSGPLGAPATD